MKAKLKISSLLILALSAGFTLAQPEVNLDAGSKTVKPESKIPQTSIKAPVQTVYKEAVFAGGCFWCMEPPFDKTKGVIETEAGYSGGVLKNPSYKQVTGGNTGHYEVIKVVYDPRLVNYKKLLEIFWQNIDPVDGRGQFCDKGPQYLSAIFVENEEQRKAAMDSLRKLEYSGSANGEVKPGAIQTKILDAAVFYSAEEYHQNYYQKNPLRYRYYRSRCGRDKRLQQLWQLKK